MTIADLLERYLALPLCGCACDCGQPVEDAGASCEHCAAGEHFTEPDACCEHKAGCPQEAHR